jgi:hypothetical protein
MKLKVLLAILSVFAINSLTYAQISFPLGSTYSYLKGKNGDTLSGNWNTKTYNSKNWLSGNSPFYYGDSGGATLLSDMQNSYSTVYLRSQFVATNISKIEEVTFSYNYDDGFVIWLNGKNIISKNAPTTISYNAFAPINHDAGSFETSKLTIASSAIAEGTNQLAIQLFNRSLSSSDLYFDLQISGEIKTPELPLFADTCQLTVSKPAGFYKDAFNLDISLADKTVDLIYTLDGSNPQTSNTATTIKGKASLTIDPASGTSRAKTPGFIVRVSQVKDGYKPSYSKTFTYIFYDAVKTQAYPGSPWPSSSVNQQVIDLKMDSKVVSDARYKDQIDDALLDIPSISIVTDNANLFNTSTGIYVNASEHGEDWERPCSIELLDNSGKEPGFQANAGLRIRGGLGGRDPQNGKHSFRLFFRSEYGQSELKYPLFGNEGVDEFDKFDLRCERNYSWSCDGSYHHTALRDVFSRDAQGALGQPYSKSRYYHLYLNGMYWGLYQTEERPESSFAASYLGGKNDDYDVVKVNVESWPYYNETTAGNMDAWKKLYDFSIKSSISTKDYFAIQGKDENGKDIKGAEVLLDVDNLIDYMLDIFYPDNFDAPTSAWYDNNMPNNYFAIYNHTLKNKGFVFVNHDAEHSLFVGGDDVYLGGLNGNRVTLNPKMEKPELKMFQPQWLHEQLCSVAEYRTRFSDRAHEVLGQYGVFSVDSCKARLLKRKAQIDLAIITESARWGDAKTATALTKDDDWEPEVSTILDDIFPYRTNIVINQLKSANLYSSLSQPTFYVDDVQINGKRPLSGSNIILEVKNPNNKGNVYYTLDGTDPRLVGGNVSTAAKNLGTTGNLTISGSTNINARILDGTTWGPVSQVTLLNQNENYSNLKLTEIHYHPQEIINGTDTITDKDQEFIEFKNIGTSAINLTGLVVDSAVHYQFPDNAILNAGQFYVIASKPNKFYTVQGVIPSGNFSGNLSNSGEEIIVFDASGNKVISCLYSDNNPWPLNPDGYGYTLSAVWGAPTGDPNDYTYWKSSTRINGSPFADDEILAVNDNKYLEETFNVYPNPTNGPVYVIGESSQNIESFTASVFDATGRLIYQKENNNVNQLDIDLSQMGISTGIYALVLQTKNSKKSFKINYIAD